MAKAHDRKASERQKANNIELLQSSKFSDFVFQCKAVPSGLKHEFKVHRAIIYGESEYFDKLIDGGFKECLEQRAVIDEDPGIVATAFWYIYTAEYPHQEKEQEKLMNVLPSARGFFDNKFEAHMKMFDASDRLMLRSIRDHARKGLRDAVKDMITTHSQTTADFEAMLKKLYEDNSTITKKVKETIVWLIVYHIGSKGLDNCRQIPYQLLWDLYRKSDSMHQEVCSTCVDCCTDCCQRFTGDCQARMLIQEDDGNFEWLECCCRFTGMCSEYCEASQDLKSRKVYCRDCAFEDGRFICKARRAADGSGISPLSKAITVSQGMESCNYSISVIQN